jgi:hypothetical protein
MKRLAVIVTILLVCAAQGYAQPAASTPRTGEFWCLKAMIEERKDPFPRTRYVPSRILEVRMGWVRYVKSELHPDARMPLDDFLHIYVRCAEQSDQPQPTQ